MAEFLKLFNQGSAFFANFSFLLLFVAMTAYWVNLAFVKKPGYQNVATKQERTLVYMGQTGTQTANVLDSNTESSVQSVLKTSEGSNKEKYNIGNIAMFSANISLFCLLLLRWKESGHFPLSNLYESLMFLSWSCTSIHIFLIFYFGNQGAYGSMNPMMLSSSQNSITLGGLNNLSNTPAKVANLEKLLGSVLAPCALFLNAFATFSLPKEMQQAGPLVPALQSNWLMMHVTVMIISYAALMLGSLLSIAFLIYKKVATKTKPPVGLKASLELTNSQISSENQSQQSLAQPTLSISPIAANLDYLSYRIIGIGFPFLTIGILSGAVWANEAWGSYWSWDPKETWALLTWFVFAIYLHTRLTKGWEGEKPAMLASFGFLVVWMCYLGVNLLGEGLHSYGFLN